MKEHKVLIVTAFVILFLFGAAFAFSSTNKMSSSETPVISQAPEESGLTSKSWTWVQSNMVPDITTTPSKEGAFTATFGTDGRLVLGTDCNSGNAGYTAGDDGSLTIDPIASTMMYCEGSAETAYFKQIQTAKSYEIKDNQLMINLQGDTGVMVFN